MTRIIKTLLYIFIPLYITYTLFNFQSLAKNTPQLKYNEIELKEVSTDKDAGIYQFSSDVVKISENITPETFSKFANQFSEYNIKGAKFKTINIVNNTNKGPYIKYFKVKHKDYIRENVFVCTGKSEAVNYTLSNDTKRKWEKSIVEYDCIK